MNAELYARACEIFAEACDLPEADRDAHAERRSGGDADLLRAVRSMLAADAEPTPLTSAEAVRAGLERCLVLAGDEAGDAEAPPPERIGRYRVIGRLGRGGMGEVLEARQDAPDRAVALKLMRTAGAGPATLRRFRREVEFLARVTHPGIAQVYDAGVADVGGIATPYFAMELVRGAPITEYAAAKGLTVRRRLELAALVCDAVQFAHQQGVIHRDLKPSNILVADGPGGEPVPRVLDFGIARLVDEAREGGVATLATEAGQVVGTPGFMSPEQVRNEPGGVDTRTDIYALGVVLYLLLSGRMPHGAASASAFEVARATLDDEPPRLGSVAPACRGDLETIVRTAMDKEKARRYDSAAQLAADLRRFLNREPISARPATAWYLLGRFADRHRGLVAASGAAAALTLAAGVAISALYVRAERQRAAAEVARAEARREARLQRDTASFLITDTFGAAAPSAKGPDVRVLDVIDDAAGAVDARFADDAAARARVRATLANLYFSTLQLDKADASAVRALSELDAAGEGASLLALQTATLRGTIASSRGDPAAAEAVFRAALARETPDDPETAVTRLRARFQLGETLQSMGRHAEAETVLREVVAVAAPPLPSGWGDLIGARVSLAASLRAQRRAEDVGHLLQEAVELGRRHLAPDVPALLSAMNAYAGFLLASGRPGEAAEMALGAHEGVRRRYPTGHAATASTALTAARAFSAAGEHVRARSLAKDAVAFARARSDDGAFEVERASGLAASIHLAAGDVAGAIPFFELHLQGRLLAASVDEGAGVVARTRELRGLLARAPGADAASVEAGLSAAIERCRTGIPVVNEGGGPERSPRAARLLANLARGVWGLRAEHPAVGARSPALLAEAREALPHSERPAEDTKLIEAVAAELAASPPGGPPQ